LEGKGGSSRWFWSEKKERTNWGGVSAQTSERKMVLGIVDMRHPARAVKSFQDGKSKKRAALSVAQNN